MLSDEALEKLEKLAQVFMDAAEQVGELMKHLDSMLKSISWKPYRCRICGREHFTFVEAQSCAARHKGGRRRAFARGSRVAPVQYSCGRIMPRNREATMRSTELRRHKSERGGR